MQRYLYNEEFTDVAHDARPDFEVWKRTWTTQDKSRDSPKQENTFDCGTFVMISIYLMSRGVQLHCSSYNQDGVSSRELQCSIVYLISQANELVPSVSVAQHLITRRLATANRVRFKRKQRRESRIVPGGKKARTDDGPTHKFLCSTHKPLVNKKGAPNPLQTDIIPNSC